MVYRHKSPDDQLKQVLIDFWTQLSQDTLNRAIDQLPKRLTMVIKAKGWWCWISSGPTICVRDRSCFTVFQMKLSKTHASLSNSMQFLGYWRFMQIRQRICNCGDTQIMLFTLDKILKLWDITRLSIINRCKVISNTVRFFWPTLY